MPPNSFGGAASTTRRASRRPCCEHGTRTGETQYSKLEAQRGDSGPTCRRIHSAVQLQPLGAPQGGRAVSADRGLAKLNTQSWKHNGVTADPHAAEFIRRCSFNHSARLKEAVL